MNCLHVITLTVIGVATIWATLECLGRGIYALMIWAVSKEFPH